MVVYQFISRCRFGADSWYHGVPDPPPSPTGRGTLSSDEGRTRHVPPVNCDYRGANVPAQRTRRTRGDETAMRPFAKLVWTFLTVVT